MPLNDAVPPAGADALAVVVVNYGSSALLRGNLVPLAAALRAAGAVTVVVDSFSSAAEAGAVRTLAAEQGWTFVGLADNPGFGAAVNVGVRAASATGRRQFLLLNPDAVVSAETVLELARDGAAAPMDVLSPRIDAPGAGWSFAGSRLDLGRGRVRSARAVAAGLPGQWEPWLVGTCLLVHRDLLAAVGGMDEAYFMYWEDLEFSHRSLLAGARLRVREDLTAEHAEGGTQSSGPGRAKSDLYYYYNCRNRLLFAAQHLSRRRLLRWIAATPSAGLEILLRGGRRQLLQSPRPALAVLRGTLAGLGLAAVALLRPAPRTAPHVIDVGSAARAA